jgi:hypothetical protein
MKKREIVFFNSVKELLIYADKNEIGNKDEFWFVINNEPIIFKSIFEYFYEG